MINELTESSSQAVDLFTGSYHCSTKRLRQACWRWDRSEGDHDIPAMRFFRNPPPDRRKVA